MALVPADEAPWVVGFSGRAVKGAAAMRSPVFEYPEGCYFLPARDAEPPKTYSRDELNDYVNRGFATLSTALRKHRAVPGGVVLYAEQTFVQPGKARCDLSEHMDGLDHDDALGMHLHYFSRDEALCRLREWGRFLLEDAKERLLPGREKEWDRAFDSATRARITAPPPEHADIRRDAFVAMAVARELLGKDIEDVFHMVRLDRNPGLLEAVEKAARRMIKDIRDTQQHRQNLRLPGIRKSSMHPVVEVGASCSRAA